MISTTYIYIFFFFTITITTPRFSVMTDVSARNEIETQFVVPHAAPSRCPRRVSPSQNHHAITLIRVSFIFRSPFFSFLLPPFLSSRKRSSTPVNEDANESTNFEVPVGFWCSHQLFPPCKIVNHALSADKATNNSSILDRYIEDRNARLHWKRNRCVHRYPR